MISRRIQLLVTLMLVPSFMLLSGAGKPERRSQADAGSAPLDIRPSVSVVEAEAVHSSANTEQSATPAFSMDWLSINAGGEMEVTSSSFRMGMSVAQPVAGEATSAGYEMGYGFWYGVGAPPACPIAQTGELNGTSPISAADVIFLVNLIFRDGPEPEPCIAAADVDCTGTLSTADIIYLVNLVFKAGPDPCNVCTMIPSSWGC